MSTSERPAIEHVRIERASVEGMVGELRSGIDEVLDALSAIGAEGSGALELTYALTRLRPALAGLECALDADKKLKGGAS